MRAKHVLLLSALALTGCPRNPEPVVYSIEELARIAMPAVAHVETDTGTGTGFLLKDTGWLVTNFHVLKGADTAEITLGETTFTDVEVMAADLRTDLAILRLPEPLPGGLTLVSGIDDVHLGEQVVTLGNPRGLRGTLSHGVVSTVQREMDGVDFDPIQTTASISGGSSGGPLLNMRGQVIGVTSFTYKEGQNLNFAVPADHVRELLKSPGPPRTLAEVFGSESPGRYRHQPGEFAVVLRWEGDPDLDLELWSPDFVYLGDAFDLGDCWDITQGGTGEEYFVFGSGDFAEGRFIVSPYFVDGRRQRTEAELTVHFPDGRTQTLTRVLQMEPPGDQWFALIVDVDKAEVKVMDFFMDGRSVALLEWDLKADLDLIVYDHEYRRHFFAHNLPGGRDVTHGMEGLEVFRFGTFGNRNLSVGRMELLAMMQGPNRDSVPATVTLLREGRVVDRFTHTFTPKPGEPYLWHILTLNPESGEFSRPRQTRMPVRRSRTETGPGIFP